MSLVTQIGIRLVADGAAEVKRELDGVQGGLQKVGTAGAALDKVLGLVKTAFAGIAIGASVREFVQTADAMATVGARLKLATRGLEEYNQAQRDVYKVAQANNVSIEETASLYARLADPIRKLGGTAKETAGITAALAASLRISGSTGAEASSAILQFSQAMASGVLRGEEFNAVNEAAPRLMQALETSLGKTRGELREMAKQGELTADVVGNALLTSLAQLQAETATLPDTVGGAFQRLKNDVSQFVVVVNDSAGVTAGFADVLGGMAGLVNQFSEALRMAGSVSGAASSQIDLAGLTIGAIGTVLETVAVLGANTAYVIKAVGLEIGGLAAQAAALVRGDFSQVGAIHRQMKEDAEANRKEIDAFTSSVVGSTSKVLAQREALRANSISVSENAAEMAKLSRQGDAVAGGYVKLTTATKAAATENKAATAAAAKHAEEQRRLSVIISDYGTPAMEQSVAETKRLERAALAAAESLRDVVAPALDETAAETARLARQNQYLADSYDAEAAAALAAAERQTEATARLNQQIGQSLSDALMDGGKSAWEYISGLFRSQVLSPVIQAVVAPVASGATSVINRLVGSQSGGGLLGSLIGNGSTLGGLSSIFGAGMGTTLMGGLNSAGAMFSAGMPLQGAAMGLGTVAPYLAGAAALYSLLKYEATPHRGSVVGVDAMGSASTLWGDGSRILDNYQAETDVALRALLGGSVGTLNAISTAFGGSGGFSGQARFAADAKDASIGQLVLSLGARRVGYVGNGTDFAKYSPDAEQAFGAFSTDIARATRAALETIDLPQWARDTFAALADDSDLDALTRTAQAVGEMQMAMVALSDELAPLGGVFAQLSTLSSAATFELAGMVGGIDALRAKAAAYVRDYYTEREQAAIAAQQVRSTLSDAGIEVDLRTRQDLRTLLDSMTLGDESDRTSAAALLNVAETFAGISDYLAENNLTLSQLAAEAPQVALLDSAATQIDLAAKTVDGITAVNASVEALRVSIELGLAAVASATQATARTIDSWDNGGAMNVVTETP